MDKNVCPYCGWECVEIVGSRSPYSGIGRGRCPNCQSNGPEVSPPSAALDAFCNPTYLLNKTGLIRLAADEIVVKRATGEMAYSWVRRFVGSGGMTKDDYAAKADLTAALAREVKP